MQARKQSVVPVSARALTAESRLSQRGTTAVALQLVDALRAFGVDTVFGIPGGAVSPLLGALVERPEMRVVTAKHETGAMYLAMGYALATGKPGVAFTTAGPGITNALTGLASAHYDGIPVLLLAGEVSTASFGRGALQESSAEGLDAVALVRRVTKLAARIVRPDAAVATLHKAMSAMTSGRPGPAFLSVPLNVGAAQASTTPILGRVRESFEVDPAACERAFDLLADARRPLILAGAGCRDPEARRQLVRLAEATGAPVAATPKGKGTFPEDHPLYLGVFGIGGHESVIDHLSQTPDVVLVIGSGLNDLTTNAWSPLLRAERAFMQIDIDAAQLGKNYPIDLGLVGPARVVLAHMLEGRGPRAPRSGSYGARAQVPRPSPRGALTTPEVVLTMNDVCPRDAVFTADMGEHMSIAVHYLNIRAGAEFVSCLGFASMGSGLGAAIGYQLGAPSRRVYAITGDGCYLMHGAELATAVHHGIPVTIVVINDSRLNMCEHGMRDLFGASTDMCTPLIDFAAGARAMGAAGHVVRTKDELVAALRAAVAGPVVLDVRVDPSIRLEGSPRNAALRQFHAE
jgi:acetolactate synthase-1/2/3 large subunit